MKKRIILCLSLLLISNASFSHDNDKHSLTESEVSRSSDKIRFPKSIKFLERKINELQNKNNETSFESIYSQKNTLLDQKHHKSYNLSQHINNKEFELLSRFSFNGSFYTMSGYKFAASKRGMSEKDSEQEFIKILTYQKKTGLNNKNTNFNKYKDESNIIQNALKFNKEYYNDAFKSNDENNDFVVIFKQCHSELDQSRCRSKLMNNDHFQKKIYYKNFILGIYLFEDFHK